MKAIHLTISAALLGSALTSCTAYQQQAGLVGGLAGAGLGAAFGDDHQDVVAAAAVGAALAAGGAAVHEQQVRQRRDYERYGIPPEQSQPAPRQQTRREAPRMEPRAPDPEPRRYPVAERTDKANEVISPYPPRHRIDVTGFRSGQLAKDPKTGQIFRVP